MLLCSEVHRGPQVFSAIVTQSVTREPAGAEGENRWRRGPVLVVELVPRVLIPSA